MSTHRAQLRLLDAASAVLWPLAERGSGRAVRLLERLIERRAVLLGLRG